MSGIDMHVRNWRSMAIIVIALVLTGCASRLQSVPDLSVALPDHWPTQANAISVAAEPNRNAIEELAGDDAQLRALLTQAWVRNYDVRRAAIRWQQAGLALRDNDASRWPSVSASASVGVSKPLASPVTEVTVGGVPIQVSGSNVLSKSFGIGISTSYEFDLWGRISEQRKLVVANEASAAVDIAAARSLVLAHVTEKYWRIAAIDEKLTLADEQIASADALVAIEQAKRDAGLVRATDLLRIEESRRRIRDRIEVLRSDRVRYVSEIAILLDTAPHVFSLPNARLPRSLPVASALDTPVAVIERRPDLQNARLAIARAVVQLNLAEIDRLPNVLLSLPSLGSGAASLNDVLRTPVASMGASLAAPILDWGKRLRARDRERMNFDASLLDYTERVYKALVEVSTQLTAMESKQRQFAHIVQREQRLDREYLARRAQFDVGKIEKARLIEASDAVRDTQLELIDARAALWLNRIDLLKALAQPLSAQIGNY